MSRPRGGEHEDDAEVEFVVQLTAETEAMMRTPERSARVTEAMKTLYRELGRGVSIMATIVRRPKSVLVNQAGQPESRPKVDGYLVVLKPAVARSAVIPLEASGA